VPVYPHHTGQVLPPQARWLKASRPGRHYPEHMIASIPANEATYFLLFPMMRQSYDCHHKGNRSRITLMLPMSIYVEQAADGILSCRTSNSRAKRRHLSHRISGFPSIVFREGVHESIFAWACPFAWTWSGGRFNAGTLCGPEPRIAGRQNARDYRGILVPMHHSLLAKCSDLTISPATYSWPSLFM